MTTKHTLPVLGDVHELPQLLKEDADAVGQQLVSQQRVRMVVPDDMVRAIRISWWRR